MIVIHIIKYLLDLCACANRVSSSFVQKMKSYLTIILCVNILSVNIFSSKFLSIKIQIKIHVFVEEKSTSYRSDNVPLKSVRICKLQ